MKSSMNPLPKQEATNLDNGDDAMKSHIPALVRTAILTTAILGPMVPANAAKWGLVIGMPRTAGGDGCRSCGSDAGVMESLLTDAGYSVTTLIGDKATTVTVLDALASMAQQAAPSDLCVVYFSGHGSQCHDKSGDETDGRDETWLLYDKQHLDDETAAKWLEFKAGVNIFFISDSCHSETVMKRLGPGETSDDAVKAIPPDAEHDAEMEAALRKNGWSKTFPVTANEEYPVCSIISFSACEDSSSAHMGSPYSAFTDSVVAVWDSGKYQGNFKAFSDEVSRRVTSRYPEQVPVMITVGKANPSFQNSRPFAGDPTGEQDYVLPGNEITYSLGSDPKMNSGTVLSIGPYSVNVKANQKILSIPSAELAEVKITGIDKQLSRTER